MKHRGGLIAFCACCVTALVTATTAIGTHAQDNTGADRPTAAPATQSSGATSNGVAPAPGTTGNGREHAMQAVPQGVGQGGAQASRSTHSAPRAKHNTQSASQPASMPAGRDAKGQ